MGSSALLLPVAAIFEHPWTVQPGLISLAGIAALGLLSTAIAYLLYFKLLARVGATNLLLVTFLLPIVALILGALFLGEHVQPIDLLGLALIMGGLAASDGRVLTRCRASALPAAATSGSPPDSRRS